MCGISGYIKLKTENNTTVPNRPIDNCWFMGWFTTQQKKIAERGQDAFGVISVSGNCIVDSKKTTNFNEFIDHINDKAPNLPEEMYINYRGIPSTEYYGGIITHDQIQPFSANNKIVVHNGQLANDKELYQRYNFPQITTLENGDIDSYLFLQDITLYRLHEIKGSWSFVLRDLLENKVTFSHTYLGLDLAIFSKNDSQWLVWGSELDFYNTPELFPLNLPPFHTFAIKADTNTKQIVAKIKTPTPITKDEDNKKAAVVCSGGLDSTVVATLMAQDEAYDEIHILHYQYGCKAELKELDSVQKTVDYLKLNQPNKNIVLKIIPLDFLKNLGGSTLIDADAPITKGELGAETSTEYVPARNTVMLAMAAAYCDKFDIGTIALGLNREESGAYGDNSSEYYKLLEGVFNLGVLARPKLIMPLGNKMKSQIVKIGLEINAPLSSIWSCYEGGDKACGKCGPCIMSQRAFARNNKLPPYPYSELDPVADKILRQAIISEM